VAVKTAARKSDSTTGTRGDRTRARIKQAIAKLAATRDLNEITLADICRHAKVTTGALYFHFEDRDEAIDAMAIDEIEAIYARILGGFKGASVANLLQAIVVILTELHQQRGMLPRAVQSVINARPRVYAAWIAARRPLVTLLEDRISHARAAKRLPTAPAPYLAHLVLNSIEDLSMDVFQWKNPTLAPFAQSAEQWNRRQTSLWAWAILAPVPD